MALLRTSVTEAKDGFGGAVAAYGAETCWRTKRIDTAIDIRFVIAAVANVVQVENRASAELPL